MFYIRAFSRYASNKAWHIPLCSTDYSIRQIAMSAQHKAPGSVAQIHAPELCFPRRLSHRFGDEHTEGGWLLRAGEGHKKRPLRSGRLRANNFSIASYWSLHTKHTNVLVQKHRCTPGMETLKSCYVVNLGVYYNPLVPELQSYFSFVKFDDSHKIVWFVMLRKTVQYWSFYDFGGIDHAHLGYFLVRQLLEFLGRHKIWDDWDRRK